jgi:predicted lipoprotein with Yx(FWY)xxD motif/uncharacterized cupredoxin-like copper-binding protein
MYKRLLFTVSIMFALVGAPALAQDTTTIMTMDDPEYGTFFTDPEGMALYIFLPDVPNSGESTCYDQCEENWPVFSAEEPLTLPEGVPGELDTITRTDDTTQVTYNGWPLYYWINDKEPGDVTGQGVGDVWFLAVPTEGDAIPGADVPEASPEASPMASPGASPAAGNQVEVVLTEFEIQMATELPAGQTVFMISNTGEFPHNFEIEGQGIEMELEQDLQGGEHGMLEVNLEPGTYTIYCPVGNHEDRGMTLELTVTE